MAEKPILIDDQKTPYQSVLLFAAFHSRNRYNPNSDARKRECELFAIEVVAVSISTRIADYVTTPF